MISKDTRMTGIGKCNNCKREIIKGENYYIVMQEKYFKDKCKDMLDTVISVPVKKLFYICEGCGKK